jgi:hypothetical protein
MIPRSTNRSSTSEEVGTACSITNAYDKDPGIKRFAKDRQARVVRKSAKPKVA